MDWNVAVLFNVMVVLGTSCGVWLNRVIPNLFLSIFAFLMLSYLGWDTWKKGASYKKKMLADEKKKADRERKRTE